MVLKDNLWSIHNMSVNLIVLTHFAAIKCTLNYSYFYIRKQERKKGPSLFPRTSGIESFGSTERTVAVRKPRGSPATDIGQ